MAVYVDNMRATFGRMKLSHMVADSSEELMEMAAKLGLKEAWIQDKGTYREHFDVSVGHRARALELGAKSVTMRELGAVLRTKKEAAARQEDKTTSQA